MTEVQTSRYSLSGAQYAKTIILTALSNNTGGCNITVIILRVFCVRDRVHEWLWDIIFLSSLLSLRIKILGIEERKYKCNININVIQKKLNFTTLSFIN